jgi:NhaP-type Na+/H+ or K+/H+ antiporter
VAAPGARPSSPSSRWPDVARSRRYSGAVDSPSLTLALAMLVGIAAQAIARHLRLPGVVLVLAAGVLVGPDGLDLVRPGAMGGALHDFVGFAIALILFEGGLHMQLQRLRQQAVPIRRFVTLGALITAIGGTLTALLWMDWPWQLAILFGTLVVVTGPTVITPLVRRLRLHPHLATILEAEGIFIDAVGATVAVVALEVALVPTGESLAIAVVDVAILRAQRGEADGWMRSAGLRPHGLPRMATAPPGDAATPGPAP